MKTKLEELFEGLFGEAATLVEKEQEKMREKVPYDLATAKKTYEAMTPAEQKFATAMIRQDETMNAILDMADVLAQANAAVNVVNKISGDDIDFVKVVNVVIDNVTGLKGSQFTITIAKR